MNKKKNVTKNAIYSMTSFARASKEGNFGTLVWELKSTNHRYLDLDIRMPHFLSSVEPIIREKMRNLFKRGHVACYLKYKSGSKSGVKLQLNKSFIKEYMSALKETDTLFSKEKIKGSTTQIDLARILANPHALEESETNLDLLNKEVAKLFDDALKDFVETRAREGAALKKVIEVSLTKIEKEVALAEKRQPAILKAGRKKLLDKFEEFKAKLDPMRLEQEMVVYAHRIDVGEELDRLKAHIKEFYRVLDKGGIVGKRLDFLIQELNREANTLASKSSDLEATYAAVEIKVLLEQIREQIQNIA